MGFEINRPSSKPIIKETQSTHDGGGGNLGYMEGQEGSGGQSKKNDEEIFAVKHEEFDTFKKDGEEDLPESEFSVAKLIAQVIFALKSFIKKIFGFKP